MNRRRRVDGRFAKGNRGGPGRPRKPPPPPPAEPLGDPDLLAFELDAEAELTKAWDWLLQHAPRERVLKLVAFARQRGQRVPAHILAALQRKPSR